MYEAKVCATRTMAPEAADPANYVGDVVDGVVM
jgi:hypothetical protein